MAVREGNEGIRLRTMPHALPGRKMKMSSGEGGKVCSGSLHFQKARKVYSYAHAVPDSQRGSGPTLLKASKSPSVGQTDAHAHERTLSGLTGPPGLNEKSDAAFRGLAGRRLPHHVDPPPARQKLPGRARHLRRASGAMRHWQIVRNAAGGARQRTRMRSTRSRTRIHRLQTLGGSHPGQRRPWPTTALHAR